MGYEGEGHADELGFKFECEPAFEGEKVEGSYFIGYSRDGLQDAFDAAVNRANKAPGTTFVVSQIEVVERCQFDLDLGSLTAGDARFDRRAAFAAAAAGRHEQLGHARPVGKRSLDQVDVVRSYAAQERREMRHGFDRDDMVGLAREPVRPRAPPRADIDHRAGLGGVAREVVVQVTELAVERAVLPREK